MKLFRFVFCLITVIGTGCHRNSQLVRSIRNRDSVEVERMVADGANVNARAPDGDISLHAAIEAGDKALYSDLLKRGADPNITNDFGSSAMHMAADEQDSFWLREALANGGDPNVVNKGNKMYLGYTPIYYALMRHRGENVRVLIEAGAKLNYKNDFGNTAVWQAMEQSMFAEAKLLIENGADPRVCGEDGISILNYNWFKDDQGWFMDGARKPPHWDDAEYEKKKADYNELRDVLIEKGYLPPRGASK